jgi:hypothetical protein
MIDHKDHSHPATSAARAICRRDMASGAAQWAAKIDKLIEVMDGGYCPTPGHWLFYAASRFAGCQTKDIRLSAAATLASFAPYGDPWDQGRIRNGYTITEDPYTILRMTLHCAS